MSAVRELSRKWLGYRLNEGEKLMLTGQFNFRGFLMALIANNRFPRARRRHFENCHCRLLPLPSILFTICKFELCLFD